MTHRYFLFLIILIQPFISDAQKGNEGYRFAIDLTGFSNNTLPVSLKTPAIHGDSIIYHLPKMIPGMYAINDFGRYVSQFKAFNSNGDSLPVVKIDQNSWLIYKANRLVRLTYNVAATFSDRNTDEIVFEPGGSDEQKDTVFVMNNNCFLGYFDGMRNRNYELSVKHLPSMYGSTAMTDMDQSPVLDKFMTDSYNSIVDNPIMYCVPDTTIIKVGKTDVLISVYSPNKKVNSGYIAKKINTLLSAQTNYLGGVLPVNKYAFIIFLDDKPGVSGAQGALEHSYSSLYYFSETDSNSLTKSFVSAAAHEFFHIITPLNIHSEEIQNFSFDNPKMSKHLWLYEGTTEYHARMVQEKYGMITPDQLLQTFSSMITNSRARYNDTLPFTAMSSGVLDQYKNQFSNVYLKGALIAMCLDIKLLQLSNGKYGLISLIKDLSNRYGKKKAFRDESLFGIIDSLTYPEIGSFLNQYVAGNKPLPLEDIFSLVGVEYQLHAETKDSSFSLGNVSLGFNPRTNRIFVRDTAGMNFVGRKLDYHIKDELISVNGTEMHAGNMQQVIHGFGNGKQSGDSLIVRVSRNVDGKDSLIDLKATMTKVPVVLNNKLSFLSNPSPAQLALRKAWLEPNGPQIRKINSNNN